MNMDLRVLAIYKQHYLDNYSNSLDCTYSSLGYYDGFDIFDANDQKTKERHLFTRSSDSPISSLWYATQEVYANNLNGLKGMQTVGLFRDSKDNDRCHWFWEEDKYTPYIAIGFAQLQDRNSLQNAVKEIEDIGNQEEVFPIEEKKCARVLTYYNFDNSDLVILAHSNSVKKLQTVLRRIEKNKLLVYLHTIQGIREDFLRSFADTQNDRSFELWEINGKKVLCNLREVINHVTLQFVTSGNNNVQSHIKEQFLSTISSNKNFRISGIKDATFSYVYGHESFNISIEKSDVRSVISLLIPGGIITHQNKLYGSEIYNIQTGFTVKCENLFTEKDIRTAKNKQGIHSSTDSNKALIEDKESWIWCKDKINEFIRMATSRFKKNDECLYAGLLSVAHTLNTLAQYGGFTMARDIYCLLFKSFDMFYRELEKAFLFSRNKSNLEEWQESELQYPENQSDLKDIKECIRTYLEAVNSVMYHTIHTDQVYLMLPGYCGTSYSIPIKLQLFYMAFMEKLIDLIYDDSDTATEYQFLISPVSEARPTTYRISFGKHEGGSCLIMVTMSHRSLVFPRAMMIILGHEIAHYVGNDGRKRVDRMLCLTESIAYILSHWTFSPPKTATEIMNDNAVLQRFWKNSIMQHLTIHFANELTEFLRSHLSDSKFLSENPKAYYANKLRRHIKKLCKEYLLDIDSKIINYFTPNNKPNEELQTALNNIQSDIEALNEDKENGEKLRNLLLNQIRDNIHAIVASDIINRVVDKIILIYKEIYSDTISQFVLDSTYTEYLESFSLSEGVVFKAINKDMVVKAREYVMRENLKQNAPEKLNDSATNGNSGGTGGRSVTENNIDEDWKIQIESFLDGSNNFLRYQIVLNNVVEYACLCRKEIERMVGNSLKRQELIKQLRKMYSHFSDASMYSYLHTYTATELYLFINKCISSYEEGVYKGITTSPV